MFTTNIINSRTDQQIYASPSSGSTNPFRRSSSASPQQNNSTTSALNIDLQAENPFDISATSQGAGLSSSSSNPTASAGIAVSDIPLELPPPPPAYVRTEESSSTAPVSPTTISTFETSTAPSGSTQARTAPPTQPEPVNEYVLKPIDWIDPATSMERRIKIITQNGRHL